MTSTVTRATVSVLQSNGLDAVTTTVGVAVMAALLLLLFQKEVARVLIGRRADSWLRAFDVALVPLLVSFFVIVTARLWELLA